MHDDDSSDDSSEDDDEETSKMRTMQQCQKEENKDNAAKLKVLERRMKKTLEVLGEDDDEPKSGVLSLPFMVNFGHCNFNIVS
ncbi:hypothetical protein Tco_0063152 [Tanacetum coccineum]